MQLRNISFINQGDKKIFAKFRDPEIISLTPLSEENIL